jgi:hypothetical protein
MDNLVASELRTRVLDAFPRNTPPNANEIVSHDCEECDQLKNDFDGLAWWEADNAFIGANFDKLPLFTPAAYQYYLPAYILAALTPRDEDDDTLIEFLVYSWSPSSADSETFLAERRDLLSTE